MSAKKEFVVTKEKSDRIKNVVRVMSDLVVFSHEQELERSKDIQLIFIKENIGDLKIYIQKNDIEEQRATALELIKLISELYIHKL